METTVPDGNGGYTTISANKFSDGAKADPARQKEIYNKLVTNTKPETLEETFPEDRITRIGKIAEDFNKYHRVYQMEGQLSHEDIISAIALELYNCREFFPAELGGKSAVDKLTDDIYRWFELNKNK